MADLKLRMEGDSSGATKAIGEVGDELTLLHRQATAQGDAQRKQSEEFWGSVTKYAAAAAAAVTAFGVASLKAFADAERVQRQLQRAAGEYTGVLEQQADALEVLLNADGDLIKQGQTLLTQWNGVGAASRETMQAILDYAAATGQDAVAATQELIRNVESGGTGLAKLGVHYDATGDKAEDLRRATAALAEKFGGAAAAEGESLYGQLRSVETAFDDVKEAIGGNIAEFLRQHDVAGKLTEALRGLQTLLGDGDVASRNKRDEEYLEDMERLNARLEHRKELAKQIADFEAIGARVAADGVRMLYAENEKGIGLIRMALEERRKLIYGDGLPAAEGGPTNQKTKAEEAAEEARLKAAEAHAEKMAKLHEKNVEDWRKYLQSIDDLEEAARKKDEADYAEELEMSAKRVKIAVKEEEDKISAMMLGVVKQTDFMQKAEEKRDELAAKWRAETAESNAQALVKQQQEWASAGDAIGAAFVDGLSSQLQKLAQGEEFDVALFVGDILASAIAIAGTAIGAAYGQPQLGASLGNLAAMGVRAGAGAISADRKARKAARTMHSGGWVGEEVPRYHSGAWIGEDERLAILQTGERVLSRQQVHHMGGPAAVDHMAAGRPAVNVYLQAIDSKSAAESFMTDLGRGLKHALRTGQGDVPRLLGVNPR